MKKFKKLKKIKLTKFQLGLIILIVFILLIGLTNLFCNTLGLGKKCHLKEGYLNNDIEAGGTMDHSHKDYNDDHSNWHGWIDPDGNDSTLLSLSNVNAQNIGNAKKSNPGVLGSEERTLWEKRKNNRDQV